MPAARQNITPPDRADGATLFKTKALAISPADGDSCCKAGAACYAAGQIRRAIEYFRQAVRFAPDLVAAHYNLGVAYNHLGQHAQAVQCYRRALQCKPGWPEAIFNLARSLAWISDDAGAETQYRALLAAQPDHVKAMFHLGTLYLHQNHPGQALQWFMQARDLAPDWALLHNNMGKAYQSTGDHSEATRCFERACRHDPGLAEAWFNRAELHRAAGRWDEAVDLYRQAIHRQAHMSAAYNNMGNALRKLKRFPQAIEAFGRVIELDPELAEGHYNLGSAYRENEQFGQALRHFSRAIELKPAYCDAWNNLALTCKDMGDLDRALSYFNHALALDADMAIAHWNRAAVHLLRGDWLQGWQDFEWRFQIPRWRTLYPHRIKGLRWDGTPIPDQTLLVHDEQGLGDTLQFVRYLPWVRQRCGRVILETRRELVTLLASSPGVDEIIVRSADRPPGAAYDQYVPLMSLARLFATRPDSITYTSPYITAPADRLAQWRGCLSEEKLKVGLVWAGRPEHANDANRSCTLRQLSALLDLHRIEFVGMQKGPAAREVEPWTARKNFIHIGDRLTDFADTSGVIMHLDLVITVDTSVAHLAGALGRPVWMLVPYIPDWRWGLEGSTTPWYPTMTLWRQNRPKDWSGVIDRIRSGLIKMAAARFAEGP